jgi:hypothetical protein
MGRDIKKDSEEHICMRAGISEREFRSILELFSSYVRALEAN